MGDKNPCRDNSVLVSIKQFRMAYESAVERKLSEFEFKAMTFVTDYAKYMLEYAHMRKLNDSDVIRIVPTSEGFHKQKRAKIREKRENRDNIKVE